MRLAFPWTIIAIGLAALCCEPLRAAWNVVTVDGRDYVSLANIAEFYQLDPPVAVGEARAETSQGQRNLLVEADSRVATIDGIRHWLCFPVLRRQNEFLVARMDLAMTIEPAWRPQRIRDLRPVRTVVIDPGHGGNDRGARNRFASEKDFTLDLGRRLRNRLGEEGVNVVMTRHNDVYVSLEERARIGNREKDSIFVSLHFNASSRNPNAGGFEIFCTTPRGAPSSGYETLRVRDMIEERGNQSGLQSFALATALHHAMIGRMDREDRGVKRARFAVLRLTETPSVLVEAGFLTNAGDAVAIADPSWRDDLADSIARGILAYINLANEQTPWPLAADHRQELQTETAQTSTDPGEPET